MFAAPVKLGSAEVVVLVPPIGAFSSVESVLSWLVVVADGGGGGAEPLLLLLELLEPLPPDAESLVDDADAVDVGAELGEAVAAVLVSRITDCEEEERVGVITTVERDGDEVLATRVEVTISSVVGDGVEVTTTSEVIGALVGAWDVRVRGGAWDRVLKLP